jgi:hypothetical protein
VIELGEERAAVHDPLFEFSRSSGVIDVDPAAEDGDGPSAFVQGCSVGFGVDPPGKPTDNGPVTPLAARPPEMMRAM